VTAADDDAALPRFPAGRSWLALTGLTALALFAVVAMLGGLGRSDQLGPAVGSGLVCWLAAMAALEPVRRASRSQPQRVPLAGMAAMGIRLLGTGLGVAVLVLVFGLEPIATAVWTLGWYLLLLAAEVVMLVRYLRRWSPNTNNDSVHR
jgi:hypothetical protein